MSTKISSKISQKTPSKTSNKTHLHAIRTMGRIAGHVRRHVTGLGDTVRQARSKFGISLLSRADIYKIISEQLPRENAEQQELTLQEYDRRMKAMAEAVRALQEKIAELQLSGHLNARTMSQAVNSIQSDDHFSADERNILATILKQNIVLQKPELAAKGTRKDIE
ncbi:MAG: hypothetical protein HQL21_05915 [Candidatus Omnitrophica bacterium]|nr:hypothetical protein [Candidatus Omnitrophota bacterium]